MFVDAVQALGSSLVTPSGTIAITHVAIRF